MANNNRFRGIRTPVASGSVLGRLASGTGDVQPIAINDLAAALAKQPSGGGGSGLTPIVDKDILANISGSSAVPIGNTLSAILDDIIGATPGLIINRGSSAWQGLSQSGLLDGLGATRGDVLFRGASGWTGLTPGTAGQVLTSGGIGADPSWSTVTVPTAANPTATASDTAVNGSATTFMRSDAAPAVQKASASQFGLVKVDGSTITASGGIISAGTPAPDGFWNGAVTAVTTANITGDGTQYTLVNWTQNNAWGATLFNPTTGVVTAPADGVIFVNGGAFLYGITSAMTEGYTYIAPPSGGDYYSFLGNVGALYYGSGEEILPISAAIPVSAGDTFVIKVVVAGGSKVVGLFGTMADSPFSFTFFKTTSGPGGGGGSIDQFGPPSVSDYTLTTQGSFTTSPTWTNTAIGAVLTGGNTVSGTTASLQTALKTAPSTPWSLSARFRFNLANGDYRGAGLCVSDGTKFIMFGVFQNPGTVYAIKQYSTSSASSGYAFDPTWYMNYEYWKIQDDGTNRNYFVSNDGANWTRWYTETRTTYLTASKIGFVVERGYASGSPAGDIPSLLIPWAVIGT